MVVVNWGRWTEPQRPRRFSSARHATVSPSWRAQVALLGGHWAHFWEVVAGAIDCALPVLARKDGFDGSFELLW